MRSYIEAHKWLKSSASARRQCIVTYRDVTRARLSSFSMAVFLYLSGWTLLFLLRSYSSNQQAVSFSSPPSSSSWICWLHSKPQTKIVPSLLLIVVIRSTVKWLLLSRWFVFVFTFFFLEIACGWFSLHNFASPATNNKTIHRWTITKKVNNN